ncbi:hypothetical protein ABZ840_36640 [Streptomyces sp. NPDC047117]|uniref:hypothetical protein n=1 Tax=Streptomyces sp. NPDC047117 TaxID=3155379 RepID=UPI0033D80B54
MPITVTPATGSRGRYRAGVRAHRAVLASVLAAAALSLTACRGDGTGVRPIPESSTPSSSARPSPTSDGSTSDGPTSAAPTSARPTPDPRTPELPTGLPTAPPTAPTTAATEPYRP